MKSTVLTVDELAARWAVDRKSIYLQIARGTIPTLRIGRAIRITLAAVESFEQQGSAVRST